MNFPGGSEGRAQGQKRRRGIALSVHVPETPLRGVSGVVQCPPLVLALQARLRRQAGISCGLQCTQPKELFSDAKFAAVSLAYQSWRPCFALLHLQALELGFKGVDLGL